MGSEHEASLVLCPDPTLTLILFLVRVRGLGMKLNRGGQVRSMLPWKIVDKLALLWKILHAHLSSRLCLILHFVLYKMCMFY